MELNTTISIHSSGEEPRDVKLTPLCAAIVGSPLLDIYAVVFNCASPDARAFEMDFLSTYYDAFVDVANHLRIKVNDFKGPKL